MFRNTLDEVRLGNLVPDSTAVQLQGCSSLHPPSRGASSQEDQLLPHYQASLMGFSSPIELNTSFCSFIFKFLIFKKFFWPCSLQDLSSPTRDRTHAPCSGGMES